MNKQRSKDRAPDACNCRACQNLRDECGAENYPFYSKRLLIHGWAGVLTPVEKAYRRAHSESARKAAARGAARVEALRSASNPFGRAGESGQMTLPLDVA